MQPEQMNTKAMIEYDAKKKSVGTAYVLLILLGYLGIHRLYLKRPFSGLSMLGIFLVGLVSMVWAHLFVWTLRELYVGRFAGTLPSHAEQAITLGFVCFAVVLVWILIDLCLLPRFVERHNKDLLEELMPDDSTPSEAKKAGRAKKASQSAKKVTKSQKS